MNPLWYDPILRSNVRRWIVSLGPWYQPIHFGAGVWTRPWTRDTLAQWVRCERGDRKLDRFIRPVLPFPLTGRSVLELGANAGGNLLWCAKQGATACVGIEADERYFEQSRYLKDTMTCLYGRDWPLTFYLGLAEQTDPIRAYGRRYDLGLLLNVLYHVPAERRIHVLRAVAERCTALILQGNGIGDEPDGRGYTSLMSMVSRAGLRVWQVTCVPHVRGLVVVAGRA